MAVTVANFKYRKYFLNVSDDDVAEAITTVSVTWAGTQKMWNGLDSTSRDAMRDAVLGLLVAWHLADFYTMDLEGIAANGGMPLVMKSMGGVDTKFMPVELQPSLYPLLSNTFGIRAAQMIMSSPERFGMLGSTTSLYIDNINPMRV